MNKLFLVILVFVIITGQIVSVDHFRSSFRMKTQNQVLTIRVSRGAEIRYQSGGIHRLTAKDLEPGMKVKVRHQNQTATTIIVN